MSQLGDVLELMHGARTRYGTLRATITTWRHHERAQKAFQKSMERQRAGSSGQITLYSAGGRDEPIPDTAEASVDVWLEWPRRCREERATDHAGKPSPSTRVVDGDRWWSFDEQMGAVSNEGAGEAQTGGSAQWSGNQTGDGPSCVLPLLTARTRWARSSSPRAASAAPSPSRAALPMVASCCLTSATSGPDRSW